MDSWLGPFPQMAADTEALTCAHCGESYLHHDRVEVFECAEDAAHGLRALIENHHVSITTDLVGNPSPRRHGLRIGFWCEMCEGRSELVLIQHKGNSYLAMKAELAVPR